MIEVRLGEKGGFSIFPIESDFIYFRLVVAACLFGVFDFFLELIIVYLPWKTLFSDCFIDDDFCVFNCLLLSKDAVFAASSISRGDTNLLISFVEFLAFSG